MQKVNIRNISLEGKGIPGEALLTVKPWTGSNNIKIKISNASHDVLSENYQWTSVECWHQISNMIQNGDALEGLITDNHIVDAIAHVPNNVNMMVFVTDGEYEGRFRLNRKGLLSTSALGEGVSAQKSQNAIEASIQDQEIESPININLDDVFEEEVNVTEIIPEVVSDEPLGLFDEEEPEKPKKSKNLLWIILGALFVIIVAIVAYFLLISPSEHKNPQTQNSGVCSLSAMGDQDQYSFLQKCLNSKPSEKQLMALISEAQAEKKCDLAQRLYANEARSNGSFAVLYAQEYDPKTFKSGFCFEKPDVNNAIYWYETAIELDPSNKPAQQRLKELKNN